MSTKVLTGKKLLLADDSAAIQKVIDLTFSDEGMKVTTVGDGVEALSELEQFPAPDLVMADASMPQMGGFELCQIIKRHDKYSTIPVILLVSSFEPFDEAQAKAAGADDVVTKPFQSIRELVSRVGSLLGNSATEEQAHQQVPVFESHDAHSSVEVSDLAPAESEPATAPADVTVLVEAPVMEYQGATEAAGATCVADVELQTADTKQLVRITDEPQEAVHESESQLQDTVEFEPVDYPASSVEQVSQMEPHFSQFADTSEIVTEAPVVEMTRVSDEGLLDLDDAFQETISDDDVSLDLDFGGSIASKVEPASAPATQVDADAQDAILTQPAIDAAIAEESMRARQGETVKSDLSPETIDAIARRVVEQMSDNVIREIAWEVVPGLSEALIKKKLGEPK